MRNSEGAFPQQGSLLTYEYVSAHRNSGCAHGRWPRGHLSHELHAPVGSRCLIVCRLRRC